MPLDFNRPITTRDGRKVVIYTTEAPGEYPVHGRIEGGNYPITWSSEGKYCVDTSLEDCEDLVNVASTKSSWNTHKIKENEI